MSAATKSKTYTCRICHEETSDPLSHYNERHPEIIAEGRRKGAEATGRKAKERRRAKAAKKEAAKGASEKVVEEPTTEPPSEPPKDDPTKKPSEKKVGAKVVSDLEMGQTITVQPRTITISSNYLWLARQVAIQEMGWPKDISAEDFLDTWLYVTFKANGYVLGGYIKTESPNGQKLYTEAETVELMKKAVSFALGKESSHADKS